MVSGQLKDAKVFKLDVYNGDEVDQDCSAEPGLTKAELIDHEIQIETKSGKIECKAKDELGYMKYEPGLLYHRILSAKHRG